MKNLHTNTKVLTIILFFLLFLPSCNNEEIFIVEESALIVEETEETEETNTEDEVPEPDPQIELIDDEVITTENIPVDIELHINDVNLPSLIAISNTNPSNGVLSIDYNETPNDLLDDSIVYTPNPTFSGIDSFEYTVCDAANAENCDTAIVTITVEPIEDDIATELKAFPTAEGAGAKATGGRGGKICHVNTLEWNRIGSYDATTDTYSGSLLYMLELTIPRIIVFDVSGTIVADDNHPRGGNKDNMTIAGQTAPEGGITIECAGFRLFDSNNVIIRYIRFVNTSYFQNTYSASAAFLGNGSTNVILDHCSFRYTVSSPAITFQDNNNVNGNDNITVQRSIMGDCYTGGIYGAVTFEPRQGYAGKNSIHHNLFAHISHRFPNCAGSGQFEVVENIAFNYRWRLSTFFNDSESNLENNTYKGGHASIVNKGGRNKIGAYEGSYTPKVYSNGNRVIDAPENHEPTNNSWPGLFVIWQDNSGGHEVEPTSTHEALYRVNTPFSNLGVPITKLGTDASYANVLSDVGANRYLNADGSTGTYLDTMDKNYIDDTTNGTNYWGGNSAVYRDKSNASELIYPILPTNTRAAGYDTDNDGMPDAWETLNGYNVSVNDSSEDRDNDGYTNLEEYLNLVDL